MDFLIRPIYDADGLLESWVLFKFGEYKTPICIINDFEMEKIVKIFNKTRESETGE